MPDDLGRLRTTGVIERISARSALRKSTGAPLFWIYPTCLVIQVGVSWLSAQPGEQYVQSTLVLQGSYRTGISWTIRVRARAFRANVGYRRWRSICLWRRDVRVGN